MWGEAVCGSGEAVSSLGEAVSGSGEALCGSGMSGCPMAQESFDKLPKYDEARVRRAYALLDVDGKGLVEICTYMSRCQISLFDIHHIPIQLFPVHEM